jgi:hypothetical protein
MAAERQRVVEFYDSTLYSRLNSKTDLLNTRLAGEFHPRGTAQACASVDHRSREPVFCRPVDLYPAHSLGPL